ncbi:sigma-70 family RNA polymerase sigma factor [Wenzhouxiangella marina]|uniref:RNA polymerase sigma-70 ECF-like protein n=1 Tax=Wenzhouxiangella marina TaxID=1579979 RepID=A0A0K0XXP8_9GAMM|nr:sigma-70 family RNA polymerase sigma factor [Wenzhouxiangella marina]AKS42474.1 RNA polymerase sigma-70 ECF-like protein [Wenzhouxiangella marina]MBB6085751.1 RNA polymerase sigma factor (TIGR02999 family) [Wenzhouxiangella marina]
MGSVTQLLEELRDQPSAASEKLLPLVYEDLRKLARSRLRNEAGLMTLPATALVHEAYLRLIGSNAPEWDHRGHFFAAAAEAMRRVAVDYARAARTQKRGGQLARVELDTLKMGSPGLDSDLVDLDEALTQLESLDHSMAQVVKLKYFAGLSNEETARSLGLSPRTVNRHWTAARAWLNRTLDASPG